MQKNHIKLSETKGAKKQQDNADSKEQTTKEIGGFKGPEPTRYGDWEKNGRCIDF